MYIHKLITVNWANIPDGEYSFGNLVMITGGSGAGKTTLADAVQTVMTAAKSNLYKYNPAQDETSQKSRTSKTPRTLASYVLGGEDSIFSRPGGAHCYIAIVFRPSKNEVQEHSFTALVTVSAKLDNAETGISRKRSAKEDKMQLFVIDDSELEHSLFNINSDGVKRIVNPENILTIMKNKYGDKVHSFGDTKKNYLSKLYGLFRGKSFVDHREAEKAALTYSRFMAYKKIESIKDFVINDILDPIDTASGIEHIASTLKEVSKLKEESQRLNDNIVKLEQIEKVGSDLEKSWKNIAENNLLLSLKREYDVQLSIKDNEKKISLLNSENNEITLALENAEKREKDLNSELARTQASRYENANASTNDLYVGQIENELTSAIAHLTDISQNYKLAIININAFIVLQELTINVANNPVLESSIKNALNAGSELESFDTESIQSLLVKLREMDKGDPDALIAENLVKFFKGFDDANELFHLSLNDSESGLVPLTERRRGALEEKLVLSKSDRNKLTNKIEKLESKGAVVYSAETTRTLKEIKEQIIGCDAQVLCDLVEITDPDWQSSIEGYLGNNRYMIIVPYEYEARATRIAKKMGAKVAQGERASKNAERISLHQDSIINLMRIKDPIAKAYLTASYGNVITVPDIETLRKTSRGITKDGTGSGSYAMYGVDVSDDRLVFGKEGRARQLASLKIKLEALRLKISDYEFEFGNIRQLNDVVRQVKHVSCESSAVQIMGNAKNIQQKREQISRLDLSSIESLDEMLEKISNDIETIKADLKKHNNRVGSIETELKNARLALKNYSDSLQNLSEGVAYEIENLRNIRITGSEYDPQDVLVALKGKVKNSASIESLEDQIDDDNKKVNSKKGQFHSGINDYNREARGSEQVSNQDMILTGDISWGVYNAIIASYLNVKFQLKKIRDNRLSDVTVRLENTQKEMQNALTADFCQLIYDAVNRGEIQIKNLNKALSAHKFGEDTYEFKYKWVDDYKRYYKFFSSVLDMDGLGEGMSIFSNNSLSKEDQQVRDEILNLLLDTDINTAIERLKEIADYRNYYDYDIAKDSGHGEPTMLSQNGTASGGQLQTPGYVIRATAMATAFKLSVGNRHLKTLLFDESFFQMDEVRCKEVINMLTETMGFQLIFILPSRSGGVFIPLLDTHYSINKTVSDQAKGELNTITIISKQIVNKTEVEKLWESHILQTKEQAAFEFDSNYDSVNSETV